MAVNFPQDPTEGQKYDIAGLLFVYEEGRWVSQVTSSSLDIYIGATGPEGPSGATGPAGGGPAGIDTSGTSTFTDLEVTDSLGVGTTPPGSSARMEVVNGEFQNFSDTPVLAVRQNDLGEENLIQEWQMRTDSPLRVFSNSNDDYGFGVWATQQEGSQEQAYMVINGSGNQGVVFYCGTGIFNNTWKKFQVMPSGNYDEWGNMRSYPKTDVTSTFTPGFSESGRLFTVQNTVDVNIEYDGAQEGGSFIKIINETAGNINIVQSPGNTMYNTADGTTGNRILASRGLATVYNTSGTTFYIDGSGLS